MYDPQTLGCHCCKQGFNYDALRVNESLESFNVYYAPDNSCKETAYEIKENANVEVYAGGDLTGKLTLSEKPEDLFQNNPTSECPLQSNEIDQITYSYADINE